MGEMFECPRCGIRNKIGQRYCASCGQHLYYRCTHCNSFVDLSSQYCPTCGKSLNWAFKPKANLLAQTAHTPPLKSRPKYREILLGAVAVLLLLALATQGYLSYRFSRGGPQVPVGYESSQELVAESEPYVTAPPDSQYSGNPPSLKGPNEHIYMTNNPDAVNVSLAVLKDFIFADETDKELYLPGFRMCGHFAETLHNNAEQAGIRAALVIVEFEDGSAPHALNAFETTDKGLVYIDCTGTERSTADFAEWLYKVFYPMGQDNMAYVVKGKIYGTIPLKDAESPQYSYYEGYSKILTRDENLYFVSPGVVKSVWIYW
jgi:hypothetical protein